MHAVMKPRIIAINPGELMVLRKALPNKRIHDILVVYCSASGTGVPSLHAARVSFVSASLITSP